MIDYIYKNLFLMDRISKQIKLTFSGGEIITNENSYLESMEITESLCSEEELHFGSCEASVFKIKIANSEISHIGQNVTVSMVVGGNASAPFVFGTYKVQSDMPTADRTSRNIVAYDAMYDIINSDVSEWYNYMDFPICLKDFRDGFFKFLGVQQQEITLVNDDVLIEETVITTNLSGKDVMTAICEINGCFGRIKNGMFHYVFLQPFDDDTIIDITKSQYTGCEYEDYLCYAIDGLWIEGSAAEQFAAIGTGTNKYYITDNFLIYNKNAEELEAIGSRILEVIAGVSPYRPAEVRAVGNPCIELGDVINLDTRYQTITTYVLQRTLSGIQSLQDEYTASGHERYERNINSESESIKKLWGQTNALLNTVENQKVITYTYSNSSKITASTPEKDIISINLSTVADSIPILLATIPLEMDLDGNVIIRYYFDGVEMDNTRLTQYLGRGKHFLTICNYLILEKNQRGTLKITLETAYFESDQRRTNAKIVSFENYVNTGTYSASAIDTKQPTATIEKMAIKAVLYAQGLTSTKAWDGTLNFVEEFGLIPIDNAIPVREFNSSVTLNNMKPTPAGISQGFGLFRIGGVNIRGFVGTVVGDNIVVNYIFETEKVGLYTRTSKVDSSDGSFKIMTNNVYESSPIAIDNGNACSVFIDMSEIKDIASIEVEVV